MSVPTSGVGAQFRFLGLLRTLVSPTPDVGGGEQGWLGREQAPWESGEVRWGWGRVDGNSARETGAPARPGEGCGGGEGCRYRGAERPALTSRARPRPGGRGEAAATPLALSPTSPAPGHPGIKKRF